jgi:hypothetical protein
MKKCQQFGLRHCPADDGDVGVLRVGNLHLGLARAYALQGDTTKARSAYQDFFALWKDADPDIPILIAAKAEYAKLKWLGAADAIVGA